jgi:GNAT superfamily N-acetyltransferase
LSEAGAVTRAGAAAFVLRPAEPRDAADVARLVHALAEFEKLGDQAKGTAEGFHAQLFGNEPVANAMIAEVAGRAVGLALWFYNFSTFACRPGLYVEDVFVEPEHRGLGIGRAFFQALARRAVEKNCARMEWAVLDWNVAAIDFYRGLGAVGMEDWTIQRLSADRVAALADGGRNG